MNTIEKIREIMGLPKTNLYAEVKISDGRVLVTEAEAFEPGAEVRILDEGGNTVEVSAGTYTLEDGKELVITEDSRIDSVASDEVEVEVDMETIPEAEEEGYEDGIDDEKEDVREELDYEKVRDALNQGFPDLGEATIDAIATLVSSLYEGAEVEVEEEEEEKVEVDASQEFSEVIMESLQKLNERLDTLENAPASKGVEVSPNNFSKHEEKDLSNLNGVDRAVHHILQNSHR